MSPPRRNQRRTRHPAISMVSSLTSQLEHTYTNLRKSKALRLQESPLCALMRSQVKVNVDLRVHRKCASMNSKFSQASQYNSFS